MFVEHLSRLKGSWNMCQWCAVFTFLLWTMFAEINMRGLAAALYNGAPILRGPIYCTLY